MSKKIKTINNKSDMRVFAEDLASTLKSGDILALTGDLGAGKTFLVKELAKYFNIKEDVVSPTFNIIKTYSVKNKEKIKRLNHFDVYRIKDIGELVDIGYYEYILDEEAINIIEWADLIKTEIPDKAEWINIEVLDEEKRKVSIDR